MILSSASIHSACISLIMVACAENISSVLVLTRAWAIWGTQRRVTRILVMGYIGYLLIVIGTTTYGIMHEHGIHLAGFFFPSLSFTEMVGRR